MPNLLANEEVFPEFIQGAAQPESISRAALELLRDEGRRARVKSRLAEIAVSLGGPGATRRAAQVIVKMLIHADMPRTQG
jgi:lipid-A-disaccharide synthase